MNTVKNLTEYLSLKKENNEPILIAYLPAAYPDQQTSERWIKLLLNNGVDGLELGFPSRKPEMDGKVISEAHQQVYQQGFKRNNYIELAKNIIMETGFNRLIAMGYWQQLKADFMQHFLDKWKKAELTPLIFPDLDAKESKDILRKNGYSIIPFMDKREKIINYQPGKEPFIYCPTYLGKTGQENSFDRDHLVSLKKTLDKSALRDKPHLAGFGISSGADARKVMDLGYDGVIVGSAFLKKFNESEAEAMALLKDLKNGIAKE